MLTSHAVERIYNTSIQKFRLRGNLEDHRIFGNHSEGKSKPVTRKRPVKTTGRKRQDREKEGALVGIVCDTIMLVGHYDQLERGDPWKPLMSQRQKAAFLN
jgi:hypothetical protein